MTTAGRGPVVADTNVIGARLRTRGQRIAMRYDPLLVGRRTFISFQTVMELEYGARLARWGAPRLARLAALIADAETVWPGPDLARLCANLRAECNALGHALAQKEHNADLWIAATAIHLGLPLVSDDGIFEGVPGRQREMP
jgi:predicted nucleic acid-binding protein